MQSNLLSLGRFYIRSFSGVPSVCWQGISLNFLQSTLTRIFYFLSIYFVSYLHFDPATVGIILSCYGIGAIFGSYIGGRLSDYFSSLRISAGFLMLQACGYFTLIKTHSIPLLMLTVLFIGISAYGAITSSHAWILSLCPMNDSIRIKVINLLTTASNLALGVSGMMIGLIAHNGFHHIFFVTGVLLFSLAFYMLLLGEKYRIHSLAKITENDEGENAILNVTVLKYCVLPAVFFIGSIVSQLSSMYPVYIQYSFPELGLHGVSILFAINAFMVVFLATPIGNYISQFNKLWIMGIGGCLIGLGMFILIFSYSFIVAVLSCAIYSIGEIIFFCMAQFLCSQSGFKSRQGHGIGLFRVAYASSRVMGPAAGGYIYYHYNANMIWFICGILGILCLCTCEYFKSFQ